jgi:endonuclease/exonuclease/phosphatase family metal-dependent hydrolase
MLASLRLLGARVALSLALVSSAAPAHADAPLRRGRIRLVTYNVAGLPEGLSQSHPVLNLPLVGKLLNKYDLALVQEDFAYPELLRQNLRLPYASAAFVRGQAVHFGDGLSQFGKLPFGAPWRAAWRACHGVVDSYFDCLTPKGLALIRVQLTPQTSLDVYDVHLDAGSGEGDVAARAAQLEQLMTTVTEMSANNAVLVGGDFNLTEAERASFYLLSSTVRLVDVCAALHCPEPTRIDRVLFRDSPALALKPRSWRLDSAFRDGRGGPLSDHLPVAIELAWAARN